MEKIQFIQLNPEELKSSFRSMLVSELKDFKENFQGKPEDYLTRKQVAEMFSVDISTIHNWCKSGKLSPKGIGSRVYFLRSELEDSLIPLNS